MSKRFVSSILALLLLLCGCASKNVEGEIIPIGKQEEVDVSQQVAIAEEIMETLGNTDDMTRIKDRMMIGMLMDGDTDVITGGVLYLSKDETSADAIGVFDTDDLETCRSHVSDYLSDQKLKAEYYNADEAFKVSKAVLVDDGKHRVILIISKEIAKAQRIADQLLQE